MKALLALLSVAVLLCLPHAAKAGGECDKYTTSYDKTYCMGKLFVESDKELNAAYKELKESLQGDVKKQLTETQRTWIKYRDNSCSENGDINVDCNYRVNRDRAEYLRDRSRE